MTSVPHAPAPRPGPEPVATLAERAATRIARALRPWSAADVAAIYEGIGETGATESAAIAPVLDYLFAFASLEHLFAAAAGVAAFAEREGLRIHVLDRGMLGDVLAYLDLKAGGDPDRFVDAGAGDPGGARPAVVVDGLLLDHLEGVPAAAAAFRALDPVPLVLPGWPPGFAHSAARNAGAFRHALGRLVAGDGAPQPPTPEGLAVRAVAGRLAELGLSRTPVVPPGIAPGTPPGRPDPAALAARANARGPSAPALADAVADLPPAARRLALLLIGNAHLVGHARIGRAVEVVRDRIESAAASAGIPAGRIYLFLYPVRTSSQLVLFLYQHLTGFPPGRVVHGAAEAAARAGVADGTGEPLMVAAVDEISYSGRHFCKTVDRLAAEAAGLPGDAGDRIRLLAAPLLVTEHGRALHAERGVPTVWAEVLTPFRSTPEYLALGEAERAGFDTFLEPGSPPVFVAFEYLAPDNNRGRWFNRVVAPLFTLRPAAIK